MADGAAPGGATPGGGTRLVAGRYRLASVLGRGGMGTVWHAVDEMLHRDVAVKELRMPGHLDDEEREIQQQRTLREARTAARITHENVITIHDVVEDGGIPWIVMELVHADSLADILKHRGTLSPVEAAEIGLKVLDALLAAQEKGVLHRDVKPANILVTASGRVVLTDFGIATETGAQTLTATGMLIGSPNFLAPERAQGLRPSLAADLWSLGLVLYMAVEGRNPFDRPTMISTLNSILLEEPDPPRRAGVLLPVIEGLLVKDPAHRLTDKELDRLLRGVVRGDLTQAHPNAVPPHLPSASGTHAAAGPSESATVTSRADSGPGSAPGSGPGFGSGPGVPGPPAPPTYVPSVGTPAAGTHAAGTHAAPTYAAPAYAANAQAPYGTSPSPEASWSSPQYAAFPSEAGSGGSTGGGAGPGTVVSGAPGPRASRKPMILGVVALVVAVIAAVVVTVVVIGNGDDKGKDNAATGGTNSATAGGQGQPAVLPPTDPAAPSAPPTGTATKPGITPPSGTAAQPGLTPPTGASSNTAAPARVPGYTWTRDPAGFALFVPDGWKRSQSGSQIDYKDPRGKTFLRIGVDNGGVHPLDNFRAIDADFATKKQQYQTLQLDDYPTDVPGWEAAVWEFTWSGNPFDPDGGSLRPSHAIDLGIRTAQGTDFSIYVASFETDWPAAKAVFDNVVTHFREG
ncbi:serine/threonine-protein kinase [Streptodolium elevatio]|uniref:non-specific serine/threonine protein kinase n=1 Tax=Streptodolium elevatio TaxID=3157996 RepID=A0ABV3DIA6_9ACTN